MIRILLIFHTVIVYMNGLAAMPDMYDVLFTSELLPAVILYII